MRLDRDDRSAQREHAGAGDARVANVGVGRACKRAGGDDGRKDDGTAKRHSPSFFGDRPTLPTGPGEFERAS